MSYRIEIEPPAQAVISRLPAHVRAEARDLIRALSADPRPPRAKELRGKPGVYRLLVAGKWRIGYRILEDEQIVRIVRVRHKEQIDYESLGAEPPTEQAEQP